jgi:hypothetical protein
MQVSFEYNDGRVVRMERVYADILQHIKHGKVLVEEVPVQKEATIVRTSNDGDESVQPAPQTSTRRAPQPVANSRRTGNNGGRGRRGR